MFSYDRFVSLCRTSSSPGSGYLEWQQASWLRLRNVLLKFTHPTTCICVQLFATWEHHWAAAIQMMNASLALPPMVTRRWLGCGGASRPHRGAQGGDIGADKAGKCNVLQLYLSSCHLKAHASCALVPPSQKCWDGVVESIRLCQICLVYKIFVTHKKTSNNKGLST